MAEWCSFSVLEEFHCLSFEKHIFYFFKFYLLAVFLWDVFFPQSDFLESGREFFFLFCLTEEWFMFIFVFLWNFKCFIHISDSVRWKRNLQMQIWLCLKSALCCFAAYLWEMIVLYYKVSCIHIFIKCGLINHEFLQPQFFSHLFFFARKIQQKHPKVIPSIYQPKTVLSHDSDVWWCLCVSGDL